MSFFVSVFFHLLQCFHELNQDLVCAGLKLPLSTDARVSMKQFVYLEKFCLAFEFL